MDITILQGLWFFLIAVLIAVYFMLDGFDLVSACSIPSLVRPRKRRRSCAVA